MGLGVAGWPDGAGRDCIPSSAGGTPLFPRLAPSPPAPPRPAGAVPLRPSQHAPPASRAHCPGPGPGSPAPHGPDRPSRQPHPSQPRPAPLRRSSGVVRVGRGAGALGARGAKKRRPRLGRGALQNFGGADIQNRQGNYRYRTRFLELFGMRTTPLTV